MRLLDLVTDANGKTLSHTKLWANVAFACASFAFTRMALGYPSTIPAEIWWAFLGCVGASGAASKLMSLRYGGATHGVHPVSRPVRPRGVNQRTEQEAQS